VFFWGLFRVDRRKINTWLEATFEPQNIRPYGLWRGGCEAKAPALAVRPVGKSLRQFLGSHVVNWNLTTHLVQ